MAGAFLSVYSIVLRRNVSVTAPKRFHPLRFRILVNIVPQRRVRNMYLYILPTIVRFEHILPIPGSADRKLYSSECSFFSHIFFGSIYRVARAS